MTDLRFQPGSIEQLRIDELRPYARNPRTHSDGQVARLAASLVEFGWTMPILVNDELEVREQRLGLEQGLDENPALGRRAVRRNGTP